MMASVSRAGMWCRRADSGSPFTRYTFHLTRKCEPEFLPYARILAQCLLTCSRKNLARILQIRRQLPFLADRDIPLTSCSVRQNYRTRKSACIPSLFRYPAKDRPHDMFIPLKDE